MRKFLFGVATTVVGSFVVVLVEYKRLCRTIDMAVRLPEGDK